MNAPVRCAACGVALLVANIAAETVHFCTAHTLEALPAVVRFHAVEDPKNDRAAEAAPSLDVFSRRAVAVVSATSSESPVQESPHPAVARYRRREQARVLRRAVRIVEDHLKGSTARGTTSAEGA